jgi:hypothetical protein
MWDNMPKLAQQLCTWTLALGLSAVAGSSPGLAWAKPQGAPSKAAVARAGSAARSSSTTAAARPAAGAARSQTKKKRDLGPCYAPAVLVVRARDEIEPRKLALTLCDGAPNPGALDSLSVLGRPRDADRPLPEELRAYQKLPIDRGPKAKRRNPAFISPRVMRLNPGLLTRLQRVVDHFPGRTVEIVSGYRPDARVTSRHHHGRALDFRVAGVTNERLRDFLRTFDQTGVGYYPNSSFVHMDVREDKGYWVDRSGPGERPDYGTWPPRKNQLERAHDDILEGALAELEPLRGLPAASMQVRAAAAPHARAPALVASKPLAPPPKPSVQTKPAYTPPKPIIDPAPGAKARRAQQAKEPREPTDAAEVARIRKDAIRALQALR